MTEKSSKTPMIVLGLLFLMLAVGVYILLKAIMPSGDSLVQRSRVQVGPPLPLSSYKPGPPKLRKLGRELYLQHCQLCHGAQGKGDGPGARNLVPAPTPYIWGKFRHGNQFADILRTITKGSPNRRSGMIAWNWLPLIQRKALAHYILALSVSNLPQSPKARAATTQRTTPKAAPATKREPRPTPVAAPADRTNTPPVRR